VGRYYLNNFKDIKFKSLKKLITNFKDCVIMNRVITGYSYTRAYLYKMRLIDSPMCNCGNTIQDLNHVFWACPILSEEKSKIYGILRGLKLLDSFSLEYLLGNINKKIATSLKYIKMANTKFDLFI